MIPVEATAFEAFFLAAVLLFVSSHLRALRMTALIPEEYDIWPFHFLFSNVLANFLSALTIPFAGEVYRLKYFWKYCKVRKPLALAAILYERMTDTLALLSLVTLYLCWLLFKGVEVGQWWWCVEIGMALFLFSYIVFCIGVSSSDSCRKKVWQTASLFNATIKYAILDFVWSSTVLVKCNQMTKRKYLLSSLAIWASYIGSLIFMFRSYHMFGLGGNLSQFCIGLMAGSTFQNGIQLATAKSAYYATALIFVFLYVGTRAALRPVYGISRRMREGFRSYGENFRSTSERYREFSEYELFLAAIFDNNDQNMNLRSFGIDLNDATVHKLYLGGSGAVTALVEIEGKMRIRKYAFGNLSNKLQDQAEWIERFSGHLPLVQIITARAENNSFLYDMVYSDQAIDFYDSIHTTPLNCSLQLLDTIVDDVHSHHCKNRGKDASFDLVNRYLHDKVIKNADIIVRFAKEQFCGDKLHINGEEFCLKEWELLMDVDWLHQQVHQLATADIHGDLTIENIIVDSRTDKGYFLIDPNPHNIFNTALIDWGKMMQSLNMGYETMNRHADVLIKDREIRLPMNISYKYNELHSFFSSKIIGMLGVDSLREIRFHELVNYLRLCPYKIQQNRRKGLAFFACTSLLLRSYVHGDNNAHSRSAL